MKTSQSGIDFIKQFEGFESHRYQDVAGLWTIGYGHLITKEDADLLELTEKEAEELLRKDLSNAEKAVNTFVKVPLTQSQFDALVSFTFNLGGKSLKDSTLLKFLNQMHYEEAADQFLRWIKAGGVPVSGLVRRRKAERLMFLGTYWRE